MYKRKREFECVNHPNNFCYVCGNFVSQPNRRRFTDSLQHNHLQYFGIAPATFHEQWTPNNVCLSCHIALAAWGSGSSQRYMKFGVPMIWREPLCHSVDCYFCLSKSTGFGKSAKWVYPTVASVSLPVPHSSEYPIIITNFLGNNKSPNYEGIITDLLKNYKKMGVNMSLKIHFLHSHLNFFPDNLGDVSDEHCERFQQQIKTIERHYQGFWDETILGDYVWFLTRETDPKSNRRQSKGHNYF